MDNIFNDQTWEEYKKNGYVRTGLNLSPNTLETIRQLLKSTPKGSPWSSFIFHADKKFQLPSRKWLTRIINTIRYKYFPFLIHRTIKREVYCQSVFGNSKMLELVLEECLKLGITKNLAKNHLLVGHDIFLENSSEQQGFGFHEDGFSLELFYNTDDDLSVYIPLQDVDESTGGRLYVDPTFYGSQRFQQRNQLIKELSDMCEKLGCINDDRYASRESVCNSEAAIKGLRSLVAKRCSLPKPQKKDLRPIDAKAGEIILFNNKNFHSNEPWLPHNKMKRAVYIVRLFPIYDIKLRPPWTLLEGDPCNRFILDTEKECLITLDSQTNPLQKYASPMPLNES